MNIFTLKKNATTNSYKKLLWLICFLVLCFPAVHFASHIVGGDIGYRCLGNNRYEITLNVYRDCFYGASDAPFDNPAMLGIFNPRTRTLIQQFSIPFTQEDTLRGLFQDRCLLIPQDVCVHTSTYRDTITLMFSPDGYQIVYQRCCRNQTIANVVNPLETGATYDIIITAAALRVCNSSPKFKEWPPIFVCVDNPIFYDHGAIDENQDQLVYSLCTPFTGGSLDLPRPAVPASPPYDTLRWVAPVYNLDNVLGEGRPLRIDPSRGFLFARPGIQGQFVVGVCVDEYRGGELLSRTRRDFQYNIGMCRNINAVVGAPAVQCDDLTVNFESFSTGSADFVWNFDFKSGEVPVFSSTEENPSFTYPDTGRYFVQLIVEPSSVCADTMIHEIYLRNNTVQSAIQAATFDCGDSTVVTLIDRSVDTIFNITERFWEVKTADTTFTTDFQRPAFFVRKGVTVEATLITQSKDGCSQGTQVTFETGNSDPTVGIPDTLVICRRDSINLNPLFNADFGYQYRWRPNLSIDNPSRPNPKVSPRNTTTYTARIFPENSLCEVEKRVTVVVLPAPQLTDLNISKDCFNGLTLSFNAIMEGADSTRWNFGDGTSSQLFTTTRNVVHTYPDTGTYELQIVLLGALCSDTIRQMVNVESREGTTDLVLELPNKDIQTCEATVTLQARVQNIPIYEWLNAQDSVLAINRSFTVPVSGNTFYKIRASDSTGCVVEDTIRVTDRRPNFTISRNQVLCPGDTADVFAMTTDSDSLGFQWFPRDLIIQNGNTARPQLSFRSGVQTYRLLVESSFGCVDSAQVTITTIDPDLAITFDANVQCDGETVEFINTSSQPDLNYKWLFGDGNTASNNQILYKYDSVGMVNACLTIDYNVACVDTTCQRLEIIDGMIEANFSAEVMDCAIDSTILTFNNLSIAPSIAAYRWEFSNGDTSTLENPSLTLFGSEQLIAKLTIKVSEDCQIIQTDTIAVKVLSVNLDTLIRLCEGSTLQLNTGGDMDLRYTWSPAENLNATDVASPILSAMSVGEFNYSVKVEDRNNPQCQITRNFKIAVDDGLSINLPDVFNLCETGQVLSLDVDPTVNVTWTDRNGTTSTGRAVNIPGNYEGLYFVEAIDNKGCVGRDSVSITIGNGVNIFKAIGDTVTTCEGQSVLIILENTDPRDEITIRYSPNDQIISGDNTLRPTIFGFTDTIFVMYYEASNQFGCSINDSLIIKVRDFKITLPDSALVCRNSPTTINPDFNPLLEYTWTPSAGLNNSRSGNPEITITQPTRYLVDVTVGDGAGACRAQRTVDVALHPDFNLQVPRDTALCEGTQITLTANANVPVEYEWAANQQFETLLSADSIALVNVVEGSRSFFVRATDEFGCSQIRGTTVNNFPVRASVPDTTVGCIGQNVSLMATNNRPMQTLTYQWSPAERIVSGQGTSRPTVSGRQSGVITASVTNNFGCSTTIQTFLSLLDVASDQVRITATPDTISQGQQTRLNVELGNDFTYLWSPGDVLDNPTLRNPLARPLETTTFTVEITKDGCVSRKTIEVIVNLGICNEPFIFIPTAFTPNSDGRNDMLFVRGNPIKTMYFAVFNRWGQKVFESDNPNFGWDGTFKGKPLPPDVYGYYVDIECLDGETFFKKGNVSILR